MVPNTWVLVMRSILRTPIVQRPQKNYAWSSTGVLAKIALWPLGVLEPLPSAARAVILFSTHLSLGNYTVTQLMVKANGATILFGGLRVPLLWTQNGRIDCKCMGLRSLEVLESKIPK